MVSPVGPVVTVEEMNALYLRISEVERSVAETNRKIQTATVISGAVVGAGAGVIVGAICPPAGWATTKAVAVYGVGGCAVGAGVGGVVGHTLTRSS